MNSLHTKTQWLRISIPVVSQPEEVPGSIDSPSWKASDSEIVVTSGVPSIIIQDSFVIEKPSLSPSSSPYSSSRSSSSTAPVPRARTSNTKEALKDLDDDFPSVFTRSNQKEEPVAAAVDASKGEDAGNDLDGKQSLLATRMSPFFPPPSFPVDEPAPVPKPRRSPVPYFEDPVLPPASVQPVPPPRKFFDNFIDDNFIEESPKYQFEADSGSELDQSGRVDKVKPVVSERSNVTVLVLGSVEEEPALNEDSVCDMLDEAIEEHDELKTSEPVTLSTTFSVNQPAEGKKTTQVLELFNDFEEDYEDERKRQQNEIMIDAPPTDKKDEEKIHHVPNITKPYSPITDSEDDARPHEYSDGDPTVDFFNDQTVPISPVEKFEVESGGVNLALRTPKETPASKVIRRERLFSLMSTPNSEPDPDQVSVDQPIHNTPVIDLNWLDGSPESDRSSRGFGGSEQLSSAASHSESAKTGDSAVFVSDIAENSRGDTTGMNPSGSRGSPEHHIESTPPVNVSKQTTPPSGSSNKAEMSWDMYDMRFVPTPPTASAPVERMSIAPEVSVPGQDGRKRISLAPCLKSLELGSPVGNVSDAASPFPDIDEDEDEAFADEQAGKQSLHSLRRITQMKRLLHQNEPKEPPIVPYVKPGYHDYDALFTNFPSICF